MKKSPYFIALAVALAATPSAMSQTTYAKVKFRLTESYTAPDLRARDGDGDKIKDADRVFSNSYETHSSSKSVFTEEYGSKLTKFKITNKQILEALVEAGEIPTISGWSLVSIESEGGYLAATNGSEYVSISDYIDISDEMGYAETWREKNVTTERESGVSNKYSSKGKGKQRVSIDFELSDSFGRLYGVANWSAKYKEEYDTWISGSSKIKSISGYRINRNETSGDTSETSDFNEPSVIEGYISSSRAKVLEFEAMVKPS